VRARSTTNASGGAIMLLVESASYTAGSG
jgi:hypothetical protein